MMSVHLVGDSWCNSHLAAMIGATSTCRNPGSTAREVLKRLTMPSGTRVVVVVAGVNDAVRHTGPRAYASGMAGIARASLQAGAIPLLMELPRLGPAPATMPQRIKRWALRWIIDGGLVDVTHRYRDALVVRMCEMWRAPWTIVPFPNVPPSGWGDPMHLNDTGRRILATEFVKRMPPVT